MYGALITLKSQLNGIGHYFASDYYIFNLLKQDIGEEDTVRCGGSSHFGHYSLLSLSVGRPKENNYGKSGYRI